MTAGGVIEKAKDFASTATVEAVGGPARLKVMLLLGAVFGLEGADKASISAIAGSLEKAFHIGNTDIGILIAAVSFAGAIFSIPAGILADLTSRWRMLPVSIPLWSVAEIVSGTATSFTYLLVARVFLCAMAAAAAPTVATLVGDFFPPQARARAYGTILGGELLGVAIGFLLSVEISVRLGWPWSLYLTSTLGIAIAALIWLFLVEPVRGSQSSIRFGQQDIPDPHQTTHADARRPSPSRCESEMDQADQQEGARPETLARDYHLQAHWNLVLREDPAHWSTWRVMHYLLHVRTYMLLIIASTLAYYFFAGVRGFAMLYLTQYFHVSRGYAVWLAAIIGAGALAGVLSGGRISERLLRGGRIDARIIVPALALLIAVVFLGPGFLIGSTFVGIPLLTLGFGALAAASPPIDAARLDVVHTALWGRGEAGRMSLRGALEGGAPVLFGAISDLLRGGSTGLEWTS